MNNSSPKQYSHKWPRIGASDLWNNHESIHLITWELAFHIFFSKFWGNAFINIEFRFVLSLSCRVFSFNFTITNPFTFTVDLVLYLQIKIKDLGNTGSAFEMKIKLHTKISEWKKLPPRKYWSLKMKVVNWKNLLWLREQKSFANLETNYPFPRSSANTNSHMWAKIAASDLSTYNHQFQIKC